MKIINSHNNAGYPSKASYYAPYYIEKQLKTKPKIRIINKPNLANYENIKHQTKQLPKHRKSNDIIIGGDHTTTIASVQKSESKGLLWIDGHGDYNNTKTSPTQNYHGMALSIITQNFDKDTSWIQNKIKEEKTVILGTRNLDKLEEKRLKNSKITYIPLEKYQNNPQKTIKRTKQIIGNSYHLTIDLDSINPKQSPGVNSINKNGLKLKEYFKILDETISKQKTTNYDIVEYNPYNDIKNKTQKILLKTINKISTNLNNP